MEGGDLFQVYSFFWGGGSPGTFGPGGQGPYCRAFSVAFPIGLCGILLFVGIKAHLVLPPGFSDSPTYCAF